MQIYKADNFIRNIINKETEELMKFDTSKEKQMMIILEPAKDYCTQEELCNEIGKWEIALIKYNLATKNDMKMRLMSNLIFIKKS